MLAESLLHRSYFASTKKSSTIIQMQGHLGSRFNSNFAFMLVFKKKNKKLYIYIYKIVTLLQELAAVADAQVHQLGVTTKFISQVSRSQHSKGNLEFKEQALRLP